MSSKLNYKYHNNKNTVNMLNMKYKENQLRINITAAVNSNK